jgi:stress response protein YsnF
MKIKTTRFLFLVIAVLTLSFSSSFLSSLHAEQKNNTPSFSDSIAPTYTSKETESFKALTQSTLDSLAAGKKEEMVAKLTDLETAWDEQEKNLRPKNEKIWTIIDKTLDKAISALRGSKYNPEKGKSALNTLLLDLGKATKA